jgi:metallo-beta-lactamase family protein
MYKKTIFLFLFLFFSCRHDIELQNFTGYKNAYITHFGAAKQVSGSMTLLEYGTNKMLIDCGLFYPENKDEKNYKKHKEITDSKNDNLPFDAEKIDYVFITHAHLDHIGRIPLLVKSGFKGKIFMSPGTYLLAKPMLTSSIRYSSEKRKWVFSKNNYNYKDKVTVHWNHCKWQKKIRKKVSYSGRFSGLEEKFSKNKEIYFSPCKTCTNKELVPVLNQVQIIKQKTWYSLGKYIRFELINSEHIPGSSSVLIELYDNKSNKKSFLFSGDIGNRFALLQKQIKPFPKVDYLWIETTYGTIIRDNKNGVKKFQQKINNAINKGKIVWIPAFALDRTQKVLYLINKGFNNGTINRVPIFVPSSLANDINKIYLYEFNTKKYNWFNDKIYAQYRFFPDYISRYQIKYKPPYILITTSGMMDNAYSEVLLDDLLPNSNTEIFIVGYQDPETPGGQLIQRKKVIIWKNSSIPVKATVHKFSFFSAHADYKDVLFFLKKQNKNNVKVFLVHGDFDHLIDRKNALKKNGFQKVTISELHKKYTLKISQ